MRIGITGDTHGSAQAIRRILQQTPPIELWLHTGDYAADANRLPFIAATWGYGRELYSAFRRVVTSAEEGATVCYSGDGDEA